MRFGVDYYPEHWPEDRWAEDARMMSQAGVNVVRLAEFAWARLEPEQGRFDFPWLDRAVSTLAGRGIRTVMGTPTAAPPAWLCKSHPEILPVTGAGVTLGFGARRHCCPNVRAYRDATTRIVTAMARHYAGNPDVIGWQIDNEFGESEESRCHCPACRQAFHDWLRARYETVHDLNRAWGTIFWSQSYGDFDDVITPGASPGAHNPGLLLDYKRFKSESYVGYQRLQVEILRRLCPRHFITHNMMGLYPELDYFELGRDLDFVSWDNYPRLHYGRRVNWETLGLTHDLMRGIKSRPFWVMEAQAGAAGWGERLFPSPLPGETRLWAYQAIAHGAEGVLFFRWRTCQFGQEEFWHGLLDYDGLPNRRYEEAGRLGQELSRIGAMVDATRYRAEAALLQSYENVWAWQIQPHSPALRRERLWLDYATALARRHVPLDVVGPRPAPGAERLALRGYKLVMAPALMLASEELVGELAGYVRDGGTLLLTFRTGLKDEHGRMLGCDATAGPNGKLAVPRPPAGKPLPGVFRELAGLRVEDYSSLCEGETAAVAGQGELAGWEGTGEAWAEALRPEEGPAEGEEARVLATYTSGRYQGLPAICTRALGRGHVIYVGTALAMSGLAGVVDHACRVAGAKPLPIEVEVEAESPDPWRGQGGCAKGGGASEAAAGGIAKEDGVEACVREGASGVLLFLLNHSERPRVVLLRGGDYRDVLTGEEVAAGGRVTVAPRDVRILAPA